MNDERDEKTGPQAFEAGGDLKELMEPAPDEVRAFNQVLDGGLKAGNSMGALTVLGLIVLAAAYMMYRGDRIPWEPPYAATMAEQVLGQSEADFKAVNQQGEWLTPEWPMTMYRHLREDIFLAATLAALLAVVFVLRERARAKRNSLLVYRALARDIERLRQKVDALEKTDSDAP